MDKQLIKLSLIDKWSLLTLRIYKSLPKSKIVHFDKLYNLGFLKAVKTVSDGRGGSFELGLYCLSTDYQKYKIEKSNFFYDHRLPLILSVLSLIISAIALLKS